MGKFFKRVVSCAMICLIGVAGTNLTNVDTPINTITVSATDDYTTWRQGDSRWGSMRLGSSYYTMSNSGCALTSLAKLMVMSGSVTSSSFTPATLCSFFNNNGGFSSAGNISWSVAHKYASSFTFEGYSDLSSNSVSGKADEIQELLDNGYYIILGVKSGGHWVAVDKVEGDNVYAYDPADGKYINVFNTYSSSGIYKIRKFRGANSTPIVEETVVEEVAEELPNSSKNNNTSSDNNVIPNTNTSYTTGLYQLNCELYFRIDGFTNADAIDIIPSGTQVNVSDVENGWGYICYDGNMGWINLGYTTKIKNGFNYTTGVYTNAEPLNYRESNSTSSESYGVIPAESELEVVQVRDNWGKIYYNGQPAWICMDYVSKGRVVFSSVDNIAVSKSSDYEVGVYRTQDELFLRKEANIDAKKLDLIESDTKVNVISVVDKWGKVVYDGQIGWICLDYADMIDDFSDYIPYDMNNDNSVNIKDIYYVSQKLNNGDTFSDFEISMLDFDEDGKIGNDDYILFKDIILN